LKDAVFVALIM